MPASRVRVDPSIQTNKILFEDTLPPLSYGANVSHTFTRSAGRGGGIVLDKAKGFSGGRSVGVPGGGGGSAPPPERRCSKMLEKPMKMSIFRQIFDNGNENFLKKF